MILDRVELSAAALKSLRRVVALDSDGLAVAPASAPTLVQQVIAAGNKIANTSGARGSGTRWQRALRSTRGYSLRHPPGL